MNYRIVQFENNKYAAEKLYNILGIKIPSGKFLDLVSPEYHWDVKNEYFRSCRTDNLEKLRQILTATKVKRIIPIDGSKLEKALK